MKPLTYFWKRCREGMVRKSLEISKAEAGASLAALSWCECDSIRLRDWKGKCQNKKFKNL